VVAGYDLLVGGFAVGGVHWCGRRQAWYWVIREGLAFVPAYNLLRVGETYRRAQEAKNACRLYYFRHREAVPGGSR
jgi:hypothetical protein